MNCLNSSEAPPATESSYELWLRAAALTPISQYAFCLCFVFAVFLYNFLEIHFLLDLLSGFRDQPVTLTINPSSRLFHDSVSKCRLLHGRYCSTPWLSSLHLQTVFLHYFGNPPPVNYTRQIFVASDGGTIALDWVSNARDKGIKVNGALQNANKSPIVIVVPGLGNDSSAAFVRHLAGKMAKSGCSVFVSNHQGLGVVPVTIASILLRGQTTYDQLSTTFTSSTLKLPCLPLAPALEQTFLYYRYILIHIHLQYPEAPPFAVGTSIGANILVKYLGEDGGHVPLVGAAAICCPWDSLQCDRFMRRRVAQRLHNRSLTTSLKEYANLHKDALSRLSNWESIEKAHYGRDFDDAVTRILANCETVDTYYRQCNSANYVGRVQIPLLCINSIDDPVCTSEAIPWDECRLKKNVVLATTQHGGHLPFFEGLTATSIWWVKVVDEFFSTLSVRSNPLHHKTEIQMLVSSADYLQRSNSKTQ